MATPGIFLLSTQPLSPAVTEAAVAGGVQLDAVPFIRTELLAVDELPSGSVIAVFTSQHAVEALPRIGSEWKVFCLEGATRRLLEERFGKEVVTGSAPAAAELAKVIIDARVGEGSRVIFFCGDLRREELPASLRGAGIPVEERIVYRTVLTPQRLERNYTGIAFFSPSGVESFFSKNPVNENTVYFAIGRTTAAAVHARTGKEAIVGSRPDKELLIHEMIAYFNV